MDGPVGVRACGWACSRVGMQMRMAVNKKKKEKKRKNLLIGSERADGRAEADAVKTEKKKQRKRKKTKRLTGVPSGRMGVWTCCGWACVDALAGGREWL